MANYFVIWHLVRKENGAIQDHFCNTYNGSDNLSQLAYELRAKSPWKDLTKDGELVSVVHQIIPER